MKLYVMTGQIQTGKTTWLKAFLKSAEQNNIRFDGLITPAIFDNGNKTGIEALLLPQKERFLLAQKRSDGNDKQGSFPNSAQSSAATSHQGESTQLSQTSKSSCQPDKEKKLGYDFDDKIMQKINMHLKTCKNAANFIVDEIGPLELVQNKGYIEALNILDAQSVNNALVVIRPSLLDIAQKRWGNFKTLTPDDNIQETLKAFKHI